ncbi:sialidase family protein [Caldilinea sp.]|uniref:sialidase family protein n=1 Tax=Caldilinea sp. TaxID=2293560 RepID=UPI002B90CDBA|nr:exo-alpha-sialidase [Anaerolineales bacterium]HQY91906.1 sialidase family protein [Caldilinea sp.]
MWVWDDEIVVSFTQCTHQADAGFHARTPELPAYPLQSRSLDGGRTWQTMPTPAPSPGQRGFSADEHMIPDLRVATAIELGREPLPRPCPGGIDFAHPDFALMCARTGLGTGTQAWFYTSYDRAHTWQGPYALPRFGQPGIEARTDCLVNSSSDCMLFLTASRDNGDEGAGVFLARTTDAGATFKFVAWVARSPENYLLMPSSVRVDATTLVTAIRCNAIRDRFEADSSWIDLYQSTDNGATWRYLNRPVSKAGAVGNPPALLKLRDGRLCLTYGYRAAPFGIRARVSEDGGATWGSVIHLRDDGGCSDLGYPRTIQRRDGTIVTTYYFNEQPATERYIATTLWWV